MTGLKELAFLRDLAEQNSGKYGVPDRSALPVTKGSMMVLNQLSNLETTVGRFYTNLPNRMIDEAVFSLPFSDEMGDGEWLSGGRDEEVEVGRALPEAEAVCALCPALPVAPAALGEGRRGGINRQLRVPALRRIPPPSGAAVVPPDAYSCQTLLLSHPGCCLSLILHLVICQMG